MLENFFAFGAAPAHAEQGVYSLLLVLVSYVVASFGAYMGLTLAVQSFNEPVQRKKLILRSVGAFALGSGIWSMHFIGMLAYKMRMTVSYDPWLTFFSMAIAIVIAWFVMQVTLADRLSPVRLMVSAILLGCGISAMHYMGMASMQMRADLRYVPWLFFMSVAIAILTSGAALGIFFTLGRKNGKERSLWRVVAALVMAAAICGMHYTGMASAVFTPFADCLFDSHQSSGYLVIAVIATTTILLLGILTFSVSLRLFLISSAAALFAMPLVIIVYQAITELNTNIATVDKELYGAEYHNRLIDLLQRVQEVRGLTYAVRNGDTTFAARLGSQKEDLRTMLISVDDVDRSYGDILVVNQGWQKVKKEITAPLETQDPASPTHEFQQYSEAIHALTDFMEDVADNSNLSTDAQLDSDYLVDAAVHITPGIMETIGRMRGLATGLLASGRTSGQWTDMEIQELQALYYELGSEDDDIENVLSRAKRAKESSGQFIAYHDQVIKPKLEEFQKHFGQIIFARTNSLSTAETFHLATDTIALYDMLYDKTLDAFVDLSKQRVADYTLRRNIVLSSSTAAFLGFIALFFFLHRSLVKTERAEREAAAASQVKSEFLANMSHELRTPLNSILGINRLLLEKGLTEEQHELASTVFRSSVNLLEIVNDILDLSKIEAGEMRLEHIGFDPSYVLHSVVHALDQLAAEKGIFIVRHYEKEELPYLLGDPVRLGRVLTNLIGNAIKYTAEGHVDVRIFCKKIDERHVEFRCEVADTGIGIPQSKLGSIFEKFTQADASTTRKYGGTGLGLAITKQLVELMGGTISVESEEGKGSTFWFAVPFEITDKLHEEKHIRRQKALLGTIPPAELRVLVAEDHPNNQLFIEKLLQNFGIKNFRVVENGVEALQAYREGEWDIILMDCHMPEKNGYDTTKDIRDLEKTTGRHVPIVAMTANAMVGDREKCLRYGMDEYVSKPINSDELREVLGQWVRFESVVFNKTAPQFGATYNTQLDLSMLKTFSEGDQETEKKYIRVFVEQSNKNIATLAACRSNGDVQGWREAGHMFKGGALSIGANSLAGLCAEAQNFAGTAEEQAALAEKIGNEYVKVKDRLKGLGLLS